MNALQRFFFLVMGFWKALTERRMMRVTSFKVVLLFIFISLLSEKQSDWFELFRGEFRSHVKGDVPVFVWCDLPKPKVLIIQGIKTVVSNEKSKCDGSG